MTYYETTIYIKGKRKPICVALFESKQSLDNFIDSLDETKIVRLGEVVFRSEDFYYATFKEKTLKGKA